MTSTLNDLIEEKKFYDAKKMFIDFLFKADLIDPKNDETWAPIMDKIGVAILNEEGPVAYCNFYLEMLKIFEEKLEPKWGNIHKGHIKFKLAIGKFSTDISTAKKMLKYALIESKIFLKKCLEESNLKVPFALALYKFPDFMILNILDLIDDQFFNTEKEKVKFFSGMTYQDWDVIWEPRIVNPDLVSKAIDQITPKEGLSTVNKIYREIDDIFFQDKIIVTIASIKYFLEILFYYIFYYRLKIKIINNKSIITAELYDFIIECDLKNIFPTNAIRTSIYLAFILSRTIYSYKNINDKRFNPRVKKRIVVCIKLLLDKALIEWGKEIDKENKNK